MVFFLSLQVSPLQLEEYRMCSINTEDVAYLESGGMVEVFQTNFLFLEISVQWSPEQPDMGQSPCLLFLSKGLWLQSYLSVEFSR